MQATSTGTAKAATTTTPVRPSAKASKSTKAKDKPPLYKHKNGQWCKTILGKKHYFGSDLEDALTKYETEKVFLHAGRVVPDIGPDEPTLLELANVFLDAVKRKVETGELSQWSHSDYQSTLERLGKYCGWKDFPGLWTPQDFAEIKEWLFQPVERKTAIRGGIKGRSVDRRSATTVSNDQARIRAWLNWCFASELIEAPRYGLSFHKSTAKQKRAAKTARGRRDIPADKLREFIAKATVFTRPIILMGINCGMGATDISMLTVDQFDGSEWLDCPRNKTGVERRVWLWPETLAAIEAYQERRGDAYYKHAEIAFLTSHRKLWVRPNGIDGCASAFNKLTGGAHSFYDLRRTFQTIAEESLDFPAVKFVMGHTPTSSDMSSVYRQHVSDERIEKVCEHVRRWLFP